MKPRTKVVCECGHEDWHDASLGCLEVDCKCLEFRPISKKGVRG